MTQGELLTRWTVRLALMLYVLSACLQLRRGRVPAPLARVAWTAGCALFCAHVLLAFGVFHGWSHADALRATAQETEALTGVRSGAGLYLNYLFTLAWVLDAGWWWIAGLDAYAHRSRWVDAALHGFFLFMAFNATVVFERGAIRAAGVAAVIVLAAVAAGAYRARERAGRQATTSGDPTGEDCNTE